MEILIKDKKYTGQCNALSYIYYKRIFKVNIFEDLENLRKSLINISKNDGKEQDISDFYKVLTKLIYILIYTKKQDVLENFEKWSQKLEIQDLTEDLIDGTIEIYLESFLDEETAQELDKIPGDSNKKSIFPEHEFLKMCLDYGLSTEDLKNLTYIDVVKIFLSSYAERKEEKTMKFKEATQADWDRLASL